ncbi:hypothetical protein DFQ28_002810 [Apophysomyces sp. BC1034]|nr:hypothetical protein DFQ30_006378 [Apophysomyces sp. BC1015]KAG0177472.1 hypothetical protein DFQ29_004795 [Apophysomyces sp. BC1021]KAG0189866.1 hypothetical protein DFQ28_002810 [Apophysomyces sp. BC1034]
MLYMLINIQILFTVLIVAWAEPFPSDASPAGLISEKGLIQGADDLSKLIIQQDTPPPASNAANFTVTDATPDQIADLEFYVALTAVAYCSSVIPEGRWDCANCRTTLPDAKIITTFSTTVHGTSGFIVRSDDKEAIYLIFRGTDGLRNSIADLDSILVGYPPVQGGTEVHRGFHVSYEEAAPLITTVMGDQLTQYSDYQVVVAGHSLGAALGLLAALDLFQRDSRFTPNNMRIVTAGGPRVGNRKFAYYVDSTDIQFTRIVYHITPRELKDTFMLVWKTGSMTAKIMYL